MIPAFLLFSRPALPRWARPTRRRTWSPFVSIWQLKVMREERNPTTTFEFGRKRGVPGQNLPKQTHIQWRPTDTAGMTLGLSNTTTCTILSTLTSPTWTLFTRPP